MYATGEMSKSEKEKDEDNEQPTKCCRKSIKKTKSTHIQETYPKHILTTVKIH